MNPPLDGLLVLDKPGGVTSRDAVNQALRWFPRGARVGHTGTLDPLATGVLVLCLGAATRLAEYVQAMSKTYLARIRLGARSGTDDADGTVTPAESATAPDAQAVTAGLAGFVGFIDQTPPAFSAAKVAGRRAYDLARRGQDFDLRPRKVRVYAIDLLQYEYPWLDVEVRCGKGTYIRSLAPRSRRTARLRRPGANAAADARRPLRGRRTPCRRRRTRRRRIPSCGRRKRPWRSFPV